MRIGRIVAALVVGAWAAGPLQGQVRVGPGGVVSTEKLAAPYRLDFVIPDAPAFDLVKIDPNTILRPATVRELALGLSDFGVSEGGLQIPRSFAVEVAPFLLARERSLTLQQYRSAAALYRMRVSAATGRDSAQRAQMAFGLRLSLLDRADLRTNTPALEHLGKVAGEVNKAFASARKLRGSPVEGQELTLGAAERQELQRELATVRRALADTSWNADALDLAAAVGLLAEDSIGNGLTFDRAAAWITYAKGVRTWGQLLLGARGTARRQASDGGFHPGAGISSRFYVGMDQYKAFAELGGTVDRGARPSWLLNSGGEVRIANSLWSTFSLGADWGAGGTGKRPRLSSRFSIKLGMPGVGSS